MSNTPKKSQMLNSASALGLAPKSMKEKLGLVALEPRILLDAAGFVTGAEVAMDAMVFEDAQMGVEAIFNESPVVTNTGSQDLLEALETQDGFKAPEFVLPTHELKETTPSLEVKQFEEQISEAVEAGTAENIIVFVDTSIDGYQTLIDDLPDGVEVITIDADVDGIERMAEILSSRDDVEAVHILSHGRDGEFNLGSAVVNEQSITGEYADEFAIVNAALSADADILIYGCDFGSDIDAVNALAAATGADIAASTDDTGAANVGGDWNLEVSVGDIGAEALSLTAFSGLLADADGDGVDDSVDVDDDNDGILDVIEDGASGTTETIVIFDFDEANAVNGDADQGFTSWRYNNRYTRQIATAIGHNVTGVNGNGSNNLDLYPAEYIGEPDFTVTNESRDVQINQNAEFFDNVTIDHPNGVESLDGNGFIGGFDNRGGPTYVVSPVLTTEQVAAFELGRHLQFDHLNFAAPDNAIVNYAGSSVYVTLIDGNGNQMWALAQGDLATYATGEFQTLGVQLLGENFSATPGGDAVTDAELQAVIDNLSQVQWQYELIGARSSRDTVNFEGGLNDPDFGVDATERFALDNIRISSDSDSDGLINSLDIDSDNDGITDNIEAQTTADYIAPSGVESAITDANMDGLDDNYDVRSVNGVLDAMASAATEADVLINPVDTDGDNTADYLDTNSDNEGGNDTVEAALSTGLATGLSNSSTDADGDGLFDVFDTQNGTAADDGFDVNESIATGAAALPDADGDAGDAVPLTADVDFRDAQGGIDTDGDGVFDSVDIDDDNDGILDVDEGVETQGAGAYSFTHNEDDGRSSAGAHNIYNPGSEAVVDSGSDVTIGSGLTVLNDDGSPAGNGTGKDFEFYLDGANSADLDEARANNDYLEMSFTTLGSYEADVAFLDSFSVGSQNTAGGSNNFSDYRMAVEVSTDGFATPGDVIIEDYVLDRDNSSYNGRAGQDVGLELDPDTTYTFRIYVYDDQGENVSGSSNQTDSIGRITVDDINFNLSTQSFADTDGDGIIDALDIDSDNDGITDNIEAQTTAGYIAPSGVGAGITDINRDGLDDVYDTRSTGNSDPLVSTSPAAVGAQALVNPVDTDMDGTADYQDTDSDDEGGNDTVEAALGTGPATGLSDSNTDADGDGLFDVFDTQNGTTANDGVNVNESLTAGALALPDSDGDANIGTPLTADVDFRDGEMIDTDNDGIYNPIDVDDDNDGILDVLENGTSSFSTGFQPAIFIDSASASINVGGVDILITNTDGGARIADNPRGILTNTQGGTSGEFTFSFSEPLDTLSLSIGDLDLGPGEFLSNFSINPTSVDGPAEFVGSGTSFEVQPTIADGNIVLHFTDLAGAESIDFTFNAATGFGIFFESVEFNVFNSNDADIDSDGIVNRLDIDSDNDGIADNIEAQTTLDYIAPSGTEMAIVDVNNDGLDDNFDSRSLANGGVGLTASSDVAAISDVLISPVDTDSDGDADFIDMNSDSEGGNDTVEAALGTGPATGLSDSNTDADGDGLFDVFETQGGTDSSDGYNVNESLATGAASLPDADGDAATGTPLVADVDFRDTVNVLAEDDNYTISEDGTISSNVFSDNGNGIDVAPTGTSVTEVNGVTTNVGTQITLASGALLTMNSNGTFDYNPNGAFNSLDTGETATESFTYTIDDGNGGTDTATVTITLNGDNDAPSIDLNGPDAAGTDNTAHFVEDTPGAPLLNLLDENAIIDDPENNISELQITVNLPEQNDGTHEFLHAALGDLQLSINLGSGEIISANALVFGETTFAVNYDAGVITLTNANPLETDIPSADLQGFMRLLSYENTSQNNTAGERSFDFQITDPSGDITATTTVTVARANDSPVPTVSETSNGTVAELGSGEAPTPTLIITPESAALTDALTKEEVLARMAEGETAAELGLISVSDLVAQLDIYDAEQSDFGIGVISANESEGVWQYLRTDIDGHEWTNFQLDDTGNLDNEPVPDGEALLLDPDSVLRFIPNPGFSGGADISFRVWDGTDGTASNPPSTIADNSGGAAPTALSSLSSSAFSILLAADTDGDGIINADDVDDDNDGILDTAEGNQTQNAGAYSFTHNVDNGNSTAGEHNPFNPGSEAVVDSGSDATVGAGLTVLNDDGSPAGNGTGKQFEFYLDGANSADLAEARANNDYVEMSFTTLSDFAADAAFLDNFSIGSQNTAAGSNNFADFSVAVEVSTDGFATPGDLIVEDYFLDRDDSSYNGRPGQDVGLQLQEGTTYTFRVYVYGDQGENVPGNSGQTDSIGRITVDDINFNLSTQSFADTDSDGIIDSLDIDSDNDGITDNIEAQTTTGYIAPSGSGDPDNGGTLVDVNRDGLDDNYDSRTVTAGDLAATQVEALINPVDTDSDGDADFIDTNSDNEGGNDTVEAGLTGTATGLSDAMTDADGDGLFDVFDAQNSTSVNDGFNVNESLANGAATLPDSDGDASGNVPLEHDVDFRDAQLDIDTDGDGVVDALDVDDDNDGILDVDEGVETQNAGAYSFTHNVDNGNSTAGEHNPFNPGSEAVVDSGSDATVGAGLTVLNDDGSPAGNGTGKQFEFYLDGANSADLAEARANNDYVEMSFTTLSDFAADAAFLDNFSIGSQNTAAGSNNFADFSVAVEVSTDGFATPGELIVEDYFLDRDDSSYNGRPGQDVGLQLEEGTTYTFRVYVYDDQGQNVPGNSGQTDSIGRITVDDINFNLSTQNFADTDSDGIINALDIDSDNDGITDNIEAQTTAGYIAPSGVSDLMVDVNNDGLDDNYDSRTTANGGVGLTADTAAATSAEALISPVNSDAGADTPDATPDYLDTDSDNDDIDDAAEAGHGEDSIAANTLSTGENDADGDGLFDVFETALDGDADDGFVVNEGISPLDGTLADINGDASVGTATPLVNDLDYRDLNSDPIAVDDALTGDEDTVTSADLFAMNPTLSDSDPDMDSLTVSRVATGNDVAALAALTNGTGVTADVAGSNGGLFTVAADGSATFDPNGDFDDLAAGESRVTEIVYQIDDGNGGTDTAVVSYTVTGVNDLIVPRIPGEPTTPADRTDFIPSQAGVDSELGDPLDLSTFFSDPDATDVVTFTLDANDLPPGLVFDGTTISGTPDPDASQGGDDGVYVIDVTVTDSNGDTFVTEVTYTITNPAPIAEDDNFTIAEDTASITGFVFDDNGNGPDTDPDSDNIFVSQVGGDAANVGQPVEGTQGGLFTLNADGSYSFDANGDFEALDAGETATTTMTYQISDGEGGFDTATVTITVEGANDTPIIVNPNDPATPPLDPSMVIPAQSGDDSAELTELDVTPFFGDVDAEPLSFSSPDTPSWMSIDPDTGVITGTPPADASQGGPNGDGVYAVTIVATDPDGATVETTVTYTIENPIPVVDTPVGPQAALDAEEVSIPTAFSDPDGDDLSYSVAGLPEGLMIDPDTGIITGTVDSSASQGGPNGDGVYTVTVTADDGEGGTVTDTFELTVTNPAPDAIDDSNTAPEDGTISGNVITGPGTDVDPDGDTLMVSQVGGDAANVGQPVEGTQGGLFTLNADGSYSFEANGDFEALDAGETATTTMTYQISDGEGGFDTATVTITVEGANDTPIIVNPNDPATPPLDPSMVIPAQSGDDSTALAPLDVTPFFGDVDAEPLSFSSPDTPSWMSIDPDTGVITGTPPADASQGGPNGDGVYAVTIVATDPDGATVETIVTYTIENPIPVVDTPVGPQAALDAEEVSIPTAFSDPDGDDLSYSVAGLPEGLMIDPDTGVITGTIDNSASQGGPNGDGVYTVTVTADDGEGGTVTDTFELTVTNPAPIAENDNYTTAEDTPLMVNILDNDSDPDGDDIVIDMVALPDGTIVPVGVATDIPEGTLTVNADGSVTFEPRLDVFGPITFGYTLSDGEGGTDVATVTINVTPVNDAPIPVDPTQPTLEPNDPNTPTDPEDPREQPLDPENYIPVQQGEDGGTVPELDLTPYFGDPDPLEPLVISLDPSELPSGLVFDPVTGVISGTPDADASQGGDPNNPGTYVVAVTVTDPSGETFTTNVTYVIENPAPIAANDGVLDVIEDTPTTLDLMGNDNDPEGDNLVITEINDTPVSVGIPTELPSGAIVTLNSDGTVTYEPVDDYTGPDSFTYTISDGEGGMDTASVALDVVPVNDPPSLIPSDPNNPVDPNNPEAILPPRNNVDGETIDPVDVSGPFDDIDSESLSFTAEGLPTGLTIDPETGVITGTLPPGTSAEGPFVVTITATDSDGATVTTEFVWEVENVAPVVMTPLPMVTANDGDEVTIPTAPSFEDADGDDVSFTAAGLPDGLTIDPETGVISGLIKGSSSVEGPYEVTVTVTDSQGESVSTSFTLDVLNPAPVIDLVKLPSGAITGQAIVGEPISINVAENVSDPDADANLSYVADDLPPGMTLDPETGIISGAPTVAQEGPYVFTVLVSDGEGGITPIEVRLTVNEDGFVGHSAEHADTLVTDVDPYEFLEGESIDLKRYFHDRALESRDSLGRMFGDRDFRGGMIVSQIADFSNEPAYLTVEAIAYDHHITVQLASPMDMSHDISIKAWDVDMANGAAMPQWIDWHDGADFMQIQRPLDVDTLRLKVRALLDNGQSATTIVEIDLRTGSVSEVGKAFSQSLTLGDQLKLEVKRLTNTGNDLVQSLVS